MSQLPSEQTSAQTVVTSLAEGTSRRGLSGTLLPELGRPCPARGPGAGLHNGRTPACGSALPSGVRAGWSVPALRLSPRGSLWLGTVGIQGRSLLGACRRAWVCGLGRSEPVAALGPRLLLPCPRERRVPLLRLSLTCDCVTLSRKRGVTGVIEGEGWRGEGPTRVLADRRPAQAGGRRWEVGGKGSE